jgi:lipoprotein-anchoring transpeptidase ErfK/SrfK
LEIGLIIIIYTTPVSHQKLSPIKTKLPIDLVHFEAVKTAFVWLVVGLVALSVGTESINSFNTRIYFQITSNQVQAEFYQKQIAAARNLHPSVHVLSERINSLDQNLPEVSTNGLSIVMSEFNEAVTAGNFSYASELDAQLLSLSDELVKKQGEIKQTEVARLTEQVHANHDRIDEILGNSAVLPSDYAAQLDGDELSIDEKLDLVRGWVEASGEEIKRRNAEVASVKKQILVRKSTMRLSMLENGQEKYSMPVSLGRPGSDTKSGDFTILDKLGTVWGIWRIWMPYWMGIYYVGSSENGIHGLPYDKAGRVYWQREVGKQNITYGCVMPTNEDMSILYNWADVGTPVTVVY